MVLSWLSSLRNRIAMSLLTNSHARWVGPGGWMTRDGFISRRVIIPFYSTRKDISFCLSAQRGIGVTGRAFGRYTIGRTKQTSHS